jgi:hypothetical protein
MQPSRCIWRPIVNDERPAPRRRRTGLLAVTDFATVPLNRGAAQLSLVT